MPKELPEVGLPERALVFFGHRFQYICEGNSMYPTMKDGEVVLVDREAEVKVGDIVVAKHPVEQTTELVKRIARINERGHYFLIGDNPDDSNDSRPKQLTDIYLLGLAASRGGRLVTFDRKITPAAIPEASEKNLVLI